MSDAAHGNGGPPDGLHYYVGGRRVPLFPHPQVFVARFTAEARAADGEARARRLPDGAAPLAFLPRDGMNVYSAPSAAACLQELRAQDGLVQAFCAYRHAPERGDPVILTSRLLVQFRSDLGIEKILSTLELLGLHLIEPLAYASPNGFLLEAAQGVSGMGALNAANALIEEGLVLFAEPDLVQVRHWRNPLPPDPGAAVWLGRQWHLLASGVIGAWEDNRGSPTICVALLDDGFDLKHPELGIAVSTGLPKIAAQFDFATGTADAAPKTWADRHGTACAGVVAAAGLKAAGAAPGCRLVVARAPEYLGVADEARMFQWAADAGADVLSCSWGPEDGWGLSCPLPTPTRLAIRYCLQHGRVGKGMSIFWAAGNGGEPIGPDGYTANPDVLAIGACTEHDTPAPYSDFGPELFACAPSSGGAGEAAILTTDLRGEAGYGGALGGADPGGDYTDLFGGTSAAAPLAAGIAALVLSANPGLGAGELRALLRATADRIGPAADYGPDGHSEHYGYGRLNAARAVAAARAAQAAAPSAPTIDGPETWSRADEAPRFHVNPGPHAYYVVEVAARPQLFDAAGHEGERNADNFYGSWQHLPFQTDPGFMLPEAAWLRLRANTRLWYRAGATASAKGYVDYMASTPDDMAELAPSIELRSGLGAPPRVRDNRGRTIIDLMRMAATGVGKAGIDGPLLWDPLLGSPVFRIEPGLASAYAVEVANRPEYFTRTEPAAAPPGRGYYSSGWIEPGHGDGARVLTGLEAHVLPLAAWDTLLGAGMLYYRLTLREGQSVVPGRVYVLVLTGDAPGRGGHGAEAAGRADEALWLREPANQVP
jgi:subtilisin family serine protease